MTRERLSSFLQIPTLLKLQELHNSLLDHPRLRPRHVRQYREPAIEATAHLRLASIDCATADPIEVDAVIVRRVVQDHAPLVVELRSVRFRIVVPFRFNANLLR